MAACRSEAAATQSFTVRGQDFADALWSMAGFLTLLREVAEPGAQPTIFSSRLFCLVIIFCL